MCYLLSGEHHKCIQQMGGGGGGQLQLCATRPLFQRQHICHCHVSVEISFITDAAAKILLKIQHIFAYNRHPYGATALCLSS